MTATMANLEDVMEPHSESSPISASTGDWKPPPGHMDSFYTRLLKLSFPDSVTAIEYCRELSSQYGFTVKQEASSNRNIYVYCSREGVPDSQRNPKPSPQRKRPSKRCDCRWRIVLFENDQERWEFRKSVNAASSEHNHEMMHPDDMIKSWPKEVTDMIVDLARKRWATHEIRSFVQNEFQGIIWNERRFYNRLSEERKKIKHRETVERVHRLINLTTRLCTVAAASDEWAAHAEQEMVKVFNACCQFAHVVPESIPSPIEYSSVADDVTDGSLSLSPVSQTLGDMRPQTPLMSSYNDSDESMVMSPTKRRRVLAIVPPNNHHPKDVARGSQAVSIPAYTIHVKSQAIRTSSTAEHSGRRTHHSKSPSHTLYTPESPASTTSMQHTHTPQQFVSPTTPTSIHSQGSTARPDVPMQMQGQYNLYQQPYDNNSFQLTSPMPGYMQFQSYNAMQQPSAGSGNFGIMDDGMIIPQRTRSLPPQHHATAAAAAASNRDNHIVDYRTFPMQGNGDHLRLKHEPEMDMAATNMQHSQDILPAVGQSANQW